MYYPYLRGKQYELLALRELCALLGTQERTVPIIEPVRLVETSGLEKCLVNCTESSITPIVIINPSVGDLEHRYISPPLANLFNDSDLSSNWIAGLHVREGLDPQQLIDNFRSKLDSNQPVALVVRHRTNFTKDFLDAINNIDCGTVVIDDSIKERYVRALYDNRRRVTLSDGFPQQQRNIDYVDRDQIVFSEEHLYYADDEWDGFSDYLTIGDTYSEGGFTPRAVAIHWTYEPQINGPIWIKHFTSMSNHDTSNVGGKFLEAASHLVDFLNQHNIHTMAADVMRRHVQDSTYPGLGVVKKLSIQNHLELVSGILCRK